MSPIQFVRPWSALRNFAPSPFSQARYPFPVLPVGSGSSWGSSSTGAAASADSAGGGAAASASGVGADVDGTASARANDVDANERRAGASEARKRLKLFILAASGWWCGFSTALAMLKPKCSGCQIWPQSSRPRNVPLALLSLLHTTARTQSRCSAPTERCLPSSSVSAASSAPRVSN